MNLPKVLYSGVGDLAILFYNFQFFSNTISIIFLTLPSSTNQDEMLHDVKNAKVSLITSSRKQSRSSLFKEYQMKKQILKKMQNLMFEANLKEIILIKEKLCLTAILTKYKILTKTTFSL